MKLKRKLINGERIITEPDLPDVRNAKNKSNFPHQSNSLIRIKDFKIL